MSCALLMALAHFAFVLVATALPHGSSVQESVLVGATLLAGLAFGATWPHLVVLTSELFGSQHLCVNYMFYDGGCASIGTVVMANLLPTAFYHATTSTEGVGVPHGRLHAASGGEAKACIGPSCFGTTHAIVAALCASGSLAAAVAAVRSSGLYRRFAPPGRSATAPESEGCRAGQQEALARPLI